MSVGPSHASIDPQAAERFTSLTRALGLQAFGVSQVTLGPGQRQRIHRHRRQEELYLVLAGRLEVLVEGESHVLGVGELLAVAPELRRQLLNPFREVTVVLAVGGAGEHEAADGEAFDSWDAADGRRPRDVPYPDDLPASQLRD